jgi:hypothetical protein
VTEGLEFLAGLIVFAIGVLSIAVSLRYGKKFADMSFWAGLACEVLILVMIATDWGYSSVQVSAYAIAIDRNIWILAPHVLAVLCILLPFVYPSWITPYLVVLSVLQAISFVPVFEFVGMDTDTSFLSAYPLLSLYLSLLCPFFFLARSLFHIPTQGSHWYKVAFGNRIALLEAINALEHYGFTVHPPETVTDSGSAFGKIDTTSISITTRMRLFPPSHALRIVWDFQKSPPPLSSSLYFTFFKNPSITRSGTTVRLEYFFSEVHSLTPEPFRDLLQRVATL